MNVAALKKYIENMPDHAVILVPSGDHSYRLADTQRTTALYDSASRIWSEDYGEDGTPEAEYGKRIPVLVIE